MSKIKLMNISRGMFVGHLDHSTMCGTGPCNCSTSPGAKLNYKDGKYVGAHVQPKRHPEVLTLLVGATSDELPARVVSCMEIANALSSKPPRLRVIPVEAALGLKPGAVRKNFRPSHPDHELARRAAVSVKASVTPAAADTKNTKNTKNASSSEG